MAAEPTVFVVDDQPAVRASLRRLLTLAGLRVEAYPDAQAFLAALDGDRPGCLVLDLRMPGMSGLDLQERLRQDGYSLPVIIVTGHGDVDSAVRAMKLEAIDFLRKPYKGEVLLEKVRTALEQSARRHEAARQRAEAVTRLARLTAREREVLDWLSQGKSAKRIAFELGLSRKTVDIHRRHIMLKLLVHSPVDLLRVVEQARGDV